MSESLEPCTVCGMLVRSRREYQPPILCNGCNNIQLELPHSPKEFERVVECFRHYRRQTHELWQEENHNDPE